MKLLKTIGWIFVVLVSIGVLNNLTQHSQPQSMAPAPKAQKIVAHTKPNANTESQAESEYKTLLSYPRLGHSREVGSLNITVNSVNQYKTVGSEPMTSVASGMYWAVSVTVRNDGSSPFTMTDSMFQIISPIISHQVNSYTPNTNADIIANENGNFFDETLNPGISDTGFIVFDMPSKYDAKYIPAFHLFVSTGLLGSKESFSFIKG